MKTLFLAAGAMLAAAALPASAGTYRGPVYSDSNPWYLDYKTSLSEARRELRNDLRGASNEADRVAAWAEYRHEVADARKDFEQEMADRGVKIRRGRVIVED